MTSSPPYRLYGAELSYFTGKVRAYLSWKGLAFDELLSDADAYRDVIVPLVGFPVIPVVVTPENEVWQDSTDIIDAFEKRHGGPSVYPDSSIQRLVALLLELYGDEWLVIPAMHYRWHHNRDWAMRAFGALSAPQGSPEEQFAIGQKRATPFAKAAVLLGAEPHMHAAVEASYEAFMAEMDAHFTQHPFLLGTRPSIGDFGLFGPLYAHQYRDPASGELMRRRAPQLAKWVERMRHPAAPGGGDYLPGDVIPITLLPVLRRMMREQLPVLVDSARLLSAWMAENPDQKRVPRVLGNHEFELEGQRGRRIVRPYSLWMLQRARTAYKALQGEERERADQLLADVGGEAFRDFVDPPLLQRDGMSVALA